MLKQTIEYTDFDDNKCVETLYFNITKAELTENLHLQERLEAMSAMMDEAKRSLTVDEINQIIDLVKTFMKLSYGIRSADGKRFIKTEQQWTEFTQTAAYDAFLFSLFSEPEKAMVFMSGILPADLREEAMKQEAKLRDQGLIDVKQARADRDMKDATPQTAIAPAETPQVEEPAVTPLARPEVTEDSSNDAPGTPDELEQFRNWQKANAQNSAKL